MDLIKIKCLNCHLITQVLKDQLIPYENKVISIRCSNKNCGVSMKVHVPNLRSTAGVENQAELFQTQIISDRSYRFSQVKLKVLKSEKTEEQEFILREGPNTIGRFSLSKEVSNADISILTNDRQISRNYHCTICVHQQVNSSLEVTLKDNNSANGTFLAKSKSRLLADDEVYLNNDDVFIIGETSLKVIIE